MLLISLHYQPMTKLIVLTVWMYSEGSVLTVHAKRLVNRPDPAAAGASSDTTRLVAVTAEQGSYSPYCPFHQMKLQRHGETLKPGWQCPAAVNKTWGGWGRERPRSGATDRTAEQDSLLGEPPSLCVCVCVCVCVWAKSHPDPSWREMISRSTILISKHAKNDVIPVSKMWRFTVFLCFISL